MRKLFLPGFGASGHLYARGLGYGWEPLEPPSFAATGGTLGAYRSWVLEELGRGDEPVWLAGHSMGGALALLAAAAEPGRIRRLTLVAPAGLPLTKPIVASLARFVCQAAQGRYKLEEIRAELARALRAPRAALRLARSLRRLDLSSEMVQVRAAGIPIEVVGCASDSLVTPTHCRKVATLAGAEYRELDLAGGHMWMLGEWPTFASLF